jgi:hypothetical protein
VNITKGRDGNKRLSTRAASRPFITGIERSSTIKSGLSCCAFSIASRPSAASPLTSQPACCSNVSRIILRIRAESSTIRIPFGTGAFHGAANAPKQLQLTLVVTGVRNRQYGKPRIVSSCICGVAPATCPAQTAPRTPDALTICHNRLMCGRYRLSRRKQMIEEYFASVSGEDDWNPGYNIAPTSICSRHPAESEGTSPGTVADPMGSYSILGETLVRSRPDD